jgi:hypothetical protein
MHDRFKRIGAMVAMTKAALAKATAQVAYVSLRVDFTRASAASIWLPVDLPPYRVVAHRVRVCLA